MKKRICGLVLLAAGIWFFSAGWSRKDSLLGALAETGTSIVNKFDGGSRTPKHYVYLGSGVLLGIVGGFLLFSRKKAE